jgi:hypothetical protein
MDEREKIIRSMLHRRKIKELKLFLLTREGEERNIQKGKKRTGKGKWLIL